jgi:hypothetical protein
MEPEGSALCLQGLAKSVFLEGNNSANKNKDALSIIFNK